MPKIDIDAVETRTGSIYPGAMADGFEDRLQQRIGDAAGLTQFGVNLVTLKPGAKSSLRHWHEQQDEFLVVVSGALTLIDDAGETELLPGDCAAFPAGDSNGHHVVNTSGQDGAFVVVGTRTARETAWYSDVDMKVSVQDGKYEFSRRDGSRIEG